MHDIIQHTERRFGWICAIGILAIAVYAGLYAIGLDVRTPVLAILSFAVFIWLLLFGNGMLHILHRLIGDTTVIRKVGFIVLSAVVCLAILAASAFLLLLTHFLPEQKIVEQDGTSYVMQAELEGWETVGFSYHKRVFLLFYERQPSWSDTDYTRWQET